MLITLSAALFASAAHKMDARGPISDTTVALGTAGVTVGTWALLKLIFDVPFYSFTDKGSFVVSTFALGAGALGWWGLSGCTASGYLQSAKTLIEGDGSAEPELLEVLKGTDLENPEELAPLIIDYFGAYENELAKAAGALEKLYKELSAALGYMRAARSGLSSSESIQADHYKEIALEVITKIKAASMVIKASKDYQRQYENEMDKQKIAAQRETAGAIRQAGNAARVQAHYVYHR